MFLSDISEIIKTTRLNILPEYITVVVGLFNEICIISTTKGRSLAICVLYLLFSNDLSHAQSQNQMKLIK